jgi:hypothetical protein
MAKTALSVLKNWFKTGLKPTETHFHNWLDSFWHKDEKIPAANISDMPKGIIVIDLDSKGMPTLNQYLDGTGSDVVRKWLYYLKEGVSVISIKTTLNRTGLLINVRNDSLLYQWFFFPSCLSSDGMSLIDDMSSHDFLNLINRHGKISGSETEPISQTDSEREFEGGIKPSFTIEWQKWRYQIKEDINLIDKTSELQALITLLQTQLQSMAQTIQDIELPDTSGSESAIFDIITVDKDYEISLPNDIGKLISFENLDKDADLTMPYILRGQTPPVGAKITVDNWSDYPVNIIIGVNSDSGGGIGGGHQIQMREPHLIYPSNADRFIENGGTATLIHRGEHVWTVSGDLYRKRQLNQQSEEPPLEI